MLFIGWLAEVSEDITNAVCIILKLSAWLGTTRIRISSKKKKKLKFGWTDPKAFRLPVCLVLEIRSMDTAVDKESLCRMAHSVVPLNILDESLQRDWARALILIFMLYLYC